MISKAEREHIRALKQYSVDGRAALKELQDHPMLGTLLKKVMPDNQEVVFDNIDWLIALIERELHTQGVKSLIQAIESHGVRK